MLTENKEVFKIQLVAKVASVILENIKVKLNSVTMTNEDGDVLEFKDRAYDVYKERCSNGVNIFLYIVNDGTEIQDRMDWLIGEEYYISNVNAEITLESIGESVEYELVDIYGEQTTREIKVQVSEELETSTNNLVSRLTEGNQGLKDLIFQTLKDDEYMQKVIESVAKLPIL